MPDFRFFATRETALKFLGELLARGDLRVVPAEQEGDAPVPTVYTNLTPELEAELRQNPKMHLHGPFSTHQPRMTALEGGYFLGDAGGGPHIIFVLPSLSPENILREGALWTQPHYQLTETQFTWPTPALKAAYADTVKRMKKHLVRWEGLWISPGALQLLKEGKAELPGALKPLGAVARAAKTLPQLRPVPATSTKTARRKVAARTAAP